MEQKNTNKGKTIKYKLIKWSTRSTAHGFPNIIKTKSRSLKFMWSICFLISVISCTVMVQKSIKDYLKYDVITQIRVINESPTIFPTVTICNVNPFLSDHAHDFLIKFYNLSNSSLPHDIHIIKAAQFVKSPHFNDEERKKLGLPINETIIYAQFNNLFISPDQFEWHYNYLYGNCYKFNSGYNMNGEPIPLLHSTASGLINGLNLELFIGIQTNVFNIKYHNGMHIFIHNNTNQPVTFEGIDLKPGTVTNIVINKSLIKKLPRPYSECQDLTNFDSVLYNFIKNSNNSYRQKDCFDLCIHKRINEKCGCNEQFYTKLSDLRPCLDDTDISCSYETVIETSKDLSAKCSMLCPLECESISFQLSTSIADYPSLAYGQSLKANPLFKKYFNDKEISDQQIKESVLAINIYFEEMKYTLINELPNLTLPGLISGVGGTLGLFLGVSLLSLIEFIEIIIDVLFVFFKKNKSNETNSTL